ncbi:MULTISPECIES: SDR family oxidoreductase [Arthrobacter]|uniref:SDR family oxidoreductase n=2 Tax=Arthrobacter TaxID=1663 RepID=A0ABU9KJY1_9MICC|nr:SDR family oxidoreductase [Arthrobacter sp. YJM1]MDP5225884.1 SDR family oxidoreductase [Arthrobacter sp. YJM1]
MNNLTVVVAGGSSPSGVAAATAFSKAGHRVYTIGSTPERIQAAAAASSQASGRIVTPLVCDLTDYDAVQRLAAEVTSEAGGVDGVLHLVGGWRGGSSMLDQSDEDWDFLHRQAVLTLRNTSRAFLPALQASAAGRFAMVGSTVAERPTAKGANYAAAKAAAEAWTQSVADAFLTASGDGTPATGAAVVLAVKSLVDDAQRAAAPERKFPGYTDVAQLAQAALDLFGQDAAEINGARLILPAWA